MDASAEADWPEGQVVWPIDAVDALTAASIGLCAVVLAVDSAAEFERSVLASGRAERLCRAGASLFAMVGEESEAAHDALDCAVMDLQERTRTSWHGTDEAAVEDLAYFVVSSCRCDGLRRVLVAVDPSTSLGSRVLRVLADVVRRETLS